MTVGITSNDDEGVLRIFVVRHGQTELNVKKILQGHMDTELNATGHEQARRVAELFRDVPLDHCVLSDLVRCVETTKYILHHQRLVRLEQTSSLRERNMGVLEGMCITDARAKYGSDFRNIGEKKDSLVARVEEVWDGLIADAQEKGWKNLVVCTHGGVITAYINYLYTDRKYGLNRKLSPDSLKVPFNTSVLTIDIVLANKQGTIQDFGNTDHLGGHFTVKDQDLR